jgi:hypothetical protein
LGELAQLVDSHEDEIASYEDAPQARMPLKMQFRIVEALRITPDSSSRNPEPRDVSRIKSPCGALTLAALGCRDSDQRAQN